MEASATIPQYEFYDVVSRRRRGSGEMYIRNSSLLLGDGSTVVITEGMAEKVPARAAFVINQRPDFYIVPSPDQTPPTAEESGLEPALSDADFEPLPADAVGGVGPGDEPAQVGDRGPDGHRVPPGRPEVSEAEKAARVAAAAAELERLPAHERPGSTVPEPPAPTRVMEASDGQPIEVPENVLPGNTPGWPVDEQGRPLRLSAEQRAMAALTALDEGDVAKTSASGTMEGLYVPPGFDLQTADGEPRCLAMKADGGQCQNVAKDGHACNTPGHPEKVAAAEQAARAAAI